jgi:Hydrogenase 4 membrane component (E)
LNFSSFELVVIASAVTAVLMVGSLHLRVNIFFYSIEALLIASATAIAALAHDESALIVVAILFALVKGVAIPAFLSWTIRRLNIHSDSGCLITAPLAMHLTIFFLAASYFLVVGLPVPPGELRAWPGSMSAISLVCTGIVLMLTRKIAISQIIGFLVLENGIYLFALTQTRGMPLIVEMGIMLDVLVGVMLCGLLVFKIQHSFEHVDVTQLSDLRD